MPPLTEKRQRRDAIEDAMASLSGIPTSTRILRLRLRQLARRCPEHRSLIEPALNEVDDIERRVQKAHSHASRLWATEFMTCTRKEEICHTL